MKLRLLLLGMTFATSCSSTGLPDTGDGGGGSSSIADGSGAASVKDGGSGAVVTAGPDGGPTGGGSADGGPTTGGGSTIGPTGGSVTFLHLGITGDTRPPSCTQLGQVTASYPTAIINAIADAFEQRGLDAVLDLGDHMYVCNHDLADAKSQMALYVAAMQRFKGTWFMAMGNHECTSTPCLQGSSNPNYVAYIDALKPVSKLPYYRVDVQTTKGLVAIVVVADNAWDATQKAWLEATLSATDTQAKYTLVARHHPPTDTSVTTNAESAQIIQAHKYALFLTGHSHEYRHLTSHGGRELVLGTGGAPLLATGSFHGYATIDQQTNGDLKVSVYDIMGDVLVDSWSVGPNP